MTGETDILKQLDERMSRIENQLERMEHWVAELERMEHWVADLHGYISARMPVLNIEQRSRSDSLLD